MGDHEARGEDFEKKAEKKLSGWGIFSSKYEDAADLFDKAANSFKLAKNWSRAASVYIKIANCHLKGDSKHEAASAYVEAANCYKKFSPQEAAQALNQAVNLFLEIGRLNMAARYSKPVSERISFFKRKYITHTGCEFDAFSGHWYPKATEIFEAIAHQSINNNLLKYSVRGILLNAGICQLCRGDPVAITNSLERYQEIDPTFSGTREYKLLADLAASMDEGDIAKFTDAIKEFDSMTRLVCLVATPMFYFETSSH
ncbi:Alpha-soluble NSF attachment protein [Dichanthelium oligosanthes]|uniref:Alpha-soluble NSF attachment protein n=1 Tax=Dichanthelium oligosanthes TaxID=888268 RepID=A0A1E5UVN6_9POAL|nr:Alpha-soluble NSF attachment protein [Dichanthelium oligosanthes]